MFTRRTTRDELQKKYDKCKLKCDSIKSELNKIDDQIETGFRKLIAQQINVLYCQPNHDTNLSYINRFWKHDDQAFVGIKGNKHISFTADQLFYIGQILGMLHYEIVLEPMYGSDIILYYYRDKSKKQRWI